MIIRLWRVFRNGHRRPKILLTNLIVEPHVGFVPGGVDDKRTGHLTVVRQEPRALGESTAAGHSSIKGAQLGVVNINLVGTHAVAIVTTRGREGDRFLGVDKEIYKGLHDEGR